MRFEVLVNISPSSGTWVRWGSFLCEEDARRSARFHRLVGYRVIDRHVQLATADLERAVLAGTKRRQAQ